MKKSIVARLAGGAVMLSVAIVLLALCFVGAALMDRAVAQSYLTVITLVAAFVTIVALGALVFTFRTVRRLRRGFAMVLADPFDTPEGGAPKDDVSPAAESQERGADADDEIGQLVIRFRVLRTMKAMASLLRATGESVAAESGRIGAGIAKVAATVRGQADVVSAAERSCAGISAGTRKIQESAAAGVEAARDGRRAVDRSIEKIVRGVQTARDLEERAARIEEAVALIADMADQTELVSLNAAIEAARAEESGRGFTSVAQQVRKLADRSGRAAAEMTELVESVLEGVRKVAVDAGESLEAGRALKADLERVSGAVDAITPLTRSAAEAADKAGASLGNAGVVLSEVTRNANDVLTAHTTLRGLVGEMEKSLQGLSRAGRHPAAGRIEDPEPAGE